MKKLVFLLLFISLPCFAGGLSQSFSGVTNLCDNTLTKSSTVAEYCGAVDGAGNLRDISGNNLLVQSEDFGTTWVLTRVTVSTNQVKNPVNGLKDADAILEDGTAANSHFTQQTNVSLVSGTTYVVSIYARPGLRTWINPHIITENAAYYFNLVGNGTIGTAIGSAFNPRITKVKGNWYRVSFSFTAVATAAPTFRVFVAEGDWDTTFDGLSTTSLYLWGAQVKESRGRWDTSPGIYVKTETVNKPIHDLAPTNAPGRAVTSLQGNDGNRLVGRSFDGVNQYYSKADHDSLDVFDRDHTSTIVTRNDSASAGTLLIWSKGAFQATGSYLFVDHGVNRIRYRINKAGATCDVDYTLTDTSDDKYYIIQTIRRSGITQVCINGACGTPVNCATYGTGGAIAFSLGSGSGGANPQDGATAYYRLDNAALSPDELNRDRNKLMAIANNITETVRTNKIVDGDMEEATTAAWTAYNNALLSKQSSGQHGGLRHLRIQRDGVNVPYVRQNATVAGTTYRITGWARSDGVGSGVPYITGGLAALWMGTTSTSWQPFDVTHTATSVMVGLFAGSIAGTEWVEFDDIVVQEYNPGIGAFTRTSTAYSHFSDGTVAEVAANIPRVSGKGGGLLIEGQNIQLHGLTEAFDSWTQIGTCAVTPNVAIAPDGTMTADLLDNTGGVNTDNRQVSSANLGNLAGRKFTLSVYARADISHIVTVRMWEAGVAGLGADLDIQIGSEWKRVDITGTAAGGGTGVISAIVTPGERSVSTGIAHFWGANLTETTFPVSYIYNAGAVATQVTRTADSYTIDPHGANNANIVLPTTFCSTCTASKLTVEFEAKCQFSGVANIGSLVRYLIGIGDVSSANNNFQLYVSTSGRIYASFTDSIGGIHFGYSAVDVVNYSNWFKIKTFIDLSDLSRMYLAVNGSSAGITYTGNAGTAIFNTTNNLIRFGSDRTASVFSHCSIRNLRIEPKEW